MAKKDFSKLEEITATSADRMTEQLNKSLGQKKQQTEPTPEEKLDRMGRLKTQGKKGCKALRINVAFTPENYSYIRIMSGCMGVTMTEFTNLVIRQYMNEHRELYNDAMEIIEKTKLVERKF